MKLRTLLAAFLILGFNATAMPAQVVINPLNSKMSMQTTEKQQVWKGLEDIILEKALKSQVTMLGERHKKYRLDNDLVIELLPRLAEHFEYLALELPRNPLRTYFKILVDYANGKITREELDPHWINEEKERSAGWFDLIDATRKAGLKIICYDANIAEASSANKRERTAFNNLKELIFDKNPDAKVIIYCGAAHISEDLEDPTYGEYLGFPFLYNFEDIMCLGFHLNKKIKDKLFTISLVPPRSTPNCDLIIDLEKGTYKYQNDQVLFRSDTNLNLYIQLKYPLNRRENKKTDCHFDFRTCYSHACTDFSIFSTKSSYAV